MKDTEQIKISEKCKWHQHKDKTWHTACTWDVPHTSYDLDMAFCPFCGRPIEKHPYTAINIENKNIYLSGPMTDIEEYNKEAFDNAESMLNKLGANHIYNPANVFNRLENESHEIAMQVSICELIRTVDISGFFGDPLYDLLVLLPGWSDSKGACLEERVAQGIGIKCIDLTELVGEK